MEPSVAIYLYEEQDRHQTGLRVQKNSASNERGKKRKYTENKRNLQNQQLQ